MHNFTQLLELLNERIQHLWRTKTTTFDPYYQGKRMAYKQIKDIIKKKARQEKYACTSMSQM